MYLILITLSTKNEETIISCYSPLLIPSFKGFFLRSLLSRVCNKILYIISIFHTLKMLGNAAAAAAKSLQLCPTLCNPIDGSPPGSPVPGIL